MLYRKGILFASAAVGFRGRLVASAVQGPLALSVVATAKLNYSTSRAQLRCRRTVVNLDSKGDVNEPPAKSNQPHPNYGREAGADEANLCDRPEPAKEHGGAGVEDDGFHEDAIVVKDEKGNDLVRIRRQPLTLIEEVPVPERVLTELELVMMAWSEEHARHYALIMNLVRIAIVVLVTIVLYVFYRTQISSERILRGVDNIPKDLKIGNVVYFDITEDGVDIGRIVIGLFTESCPLYCEYFHRRCTGSGGNGDSFRGMRMSAIVPRHCLIFGDGREMTHDLAGFNPSYLPTEHLSGGGWRGALSSIAYGSDRESPNFIIHVSSGDYKPQVFAMIVGGYNVVERMNQAGSKHGNAPKREFVIEDCGELCTLAKSHIAPMPWKLYESISKGYDAEKFGAPYPKDILADSDNRGAVQYAKLHRDEAAECNAGTKSRKRFWFF